MEAEGGEHEGEPGLAVGLMAGDALDGCFADARECSDSLSADAIRGEALSSEVMDGLSDGVELLLGLASGIRRDVTRLDLDDIDGHTGEVDVGGEDNKKSFAWSADDAESLPGLLGFSGDEVSLVADEAR